MATTSIDGERSVANYLARAIASCAWLYLLALIAVGIVLRTGGERWWWATVMLFAPRWIWAVPLAVFIPVTAVWTLVGSLTVRRRRQVSGLRGQEEEGNAKCKLQIANCKLADGTRSVPATMLPVVLAAVWVAWPLMGLCVSWNGLVGLVAGSPRSNPGAPGQSPKSQEGSGSFTQRVPAVQEENAASTKGAIFHSPGRNPGEQNGGPARLTPDARRLTPLVLRVLTCNVGLDGYDEVALAKLIDETQPDVVTLQEGYKQGSGFGVQGSSQEEKTASTEGAILDSPGRNPGKEGAIVDSPGRNPGWQKTQNAARPHPSPLPEGEGTENDGLGRPSSDYPSSFISHTSSWHVSANPGILVASRFPIVSQQTLERKNDYGTRTVGVACQLDMGKGSIAFVALHLYTPRKGLMNTPTRPWEGNDELELNTSWRSQESADVAKWVKSLPGPVIVAGDMNLTPDSEVFRRDWFSYIDAFTSAGLGYGYTYGYRTSRPLWGIRIDHILADSNWRVERCWVGPHIHSDHRPVLAELARVRSPSPGITRQ